MKILRYTENENNLNFKKISSTTEDEQMNDFDEKQTQFNDRENHKINHALISTNG